MAPGEAAAFEEHFFDCRDCAEDLRITAAFIANLRAAAPPTTKPRVLTRRDAALILTAIDLKKLRGRLTERPGAKA
jgi:hypothetical protein